MQTASAGRRPARGWHVVRPASAVFHLSRGLRGGPASRLAVRAGRLPERRLLVDRHALPSRYRRARPLRLRQAACRNRLAADIGSRRAVLQRTDCRDDRGLHDYRSPPAAPDHTIATQPNSVARTQLTATPHDSGSAAAGVACPQPPLYYALEAIPYSLARSGTVLDRLAADAADVRAVRWH